MHQGENRKTLAAAGLLANARMATPGAEALTATPIGNARFPPDPAVHPGCPERRVGADSSRSPDHYRASGFDPFGSLAPLLARADRQKVRDIEFLP